MKIYNIFDKMAFSKDREIEETIFENDQVKIIRICSLNQATDFYDQDRLEIVKIVRGRARLEIEGEVLDLKEGDILPIHSHKIHRVLSQDHAVWLCIFLK
ncbi:cupin domain-containing protein [uncultured Anaerococcus sp.]|uniref:cupin domain-containing protein n=1 Tax=uncultured Anaerococcus sp. TaxID=293428 RepID=UPI00288AC3D0|nr:cupin domain-containing protein [uncultured Anaerococcus sp.]